MNQSVEGQAAVMLNGAEAAVEMLRTHGVEILFGLCGDTSLPFYDRAGAVAPRHAPRFDAGRALGWLHGGRLRACLRQGRCLRGA